MLSFFQKKIYLTDLLEGFVDFHNHVLPGIDDGAQTIEDSKSMIAAYQNLGVNKIIASPHVMGDFYPNTPHTIENALRKLKENLDLEIQISAAAEYMMDQHFLDLISKNEILPVTDKKILVEMSYFQPPINLNEILFQLQNNSYKPILAHPERYAYYHSKDLMKFKELRNRGCEMQLNILSLSGHYGQSIQKISLRMLEENLLDYLCTDAHKLDHLEKINTIKVSKKHITPLQRLVDNNKKLLRVT